MKKLLMAALAVGIIFSICGCEDPEKQNVTTTTSVTTTLVIITEEITPSETTTGKVGGFIVREEAPGADIEWDEIGNAE